MRVKLGGGIKRKKTFFLVKWENFLKIGERFEPARGKNFFPDIKKSG